MSVSLAHNLGASSRDTSSVPAIVSVKILPFYGKPNILTQTITWSDVTFGNCNVRLARHSDHGKLPSNTGVPEDSVHNLDVRFKPDVEIEHYEPHAVGPILV